MSEPSHDWESCGWRGFTLVGAGSEVIAEHKCAPGCRWVRLILRSSAGSLILAASLVNGERAKVIRSEAKWIPARKPSKRRGR